LTIPEGTAVCWQPIARARKNYQRLFYDYRELAGEAFTSGRRSSESFEMHSTLPVQLTRWGF
jgi:hypothetical protein